MNKINGIKIVYLILAHNNPVQIKKVIEKLDYKNNSFVIHFDLNGKESDYKELKRIFNCKTNVYFSNRNRCFWGDISLVNASIDALETAYKNQVDFDYAVLISGQHLPIKSNECIEEKLKNADNNSFMDFFKLPAEVWSNQNGGLDRIKYYHFNKHPRKRISVKKIINKILYITLKSIGIRRTPPLTTDKFYGGSQWWCLTNECCRYILKVSSSRSKYYKFFKHVLIPDEMFFQTLLLNSKYKNKIINDNLTYIHWSNFPGASPDILNKSHYKDIKDSNNLWARKFDLNKSEELTKLLDSCESYEKKRFFE